MKRFGFYAGVIFCCLFCRLLNAQTEKLTAEEVVNHSLAAIASPQDRAAVKYFELTGTVKINTIGIGLDADGTMLLTSEGNKVKVAIKTPSKLYSTDQFVFDGKNVTVTTDPRGRRSPVGDFMFGERALLRDGLLGGVLSTAWPLYDPKLRNNAKLSYDGLKEVDGTQVHVLTYTSRNVESTTNVKLLFDAATFRHIKTTCVLEITAAAPKIGSGSVDANYRPAHYTLEETFSDFHQLGSYILPLHEKLSLTNDAGTGNWYFDVKYNNLNGSDLSPILK